MIREILATAGLVLVLALLVTYLVLVRPIGIELSRIEKELFYKRLEEEKICAQLKEVMKMERRFNLECIEI